MGNDVIIAVTSLVTDVIAKVRTVATPIGGLCATFCGVKLLSASDPQSVKSAKSWLITIVIALAVLYLAPTLINTVVNVLETIE